MLDAGYWILDAGCELRVTGLKFETGLWILNCLTSHLKKHA